MTTVVYLHSEYSYRDSAYIPFVVIVQNIRRIKMIL